MDWVDWVNERGDGAAEFDAGQPTYRRPRGRAVGERGRRVFGDERFKARGATIPGRGRAGAPYRWRCASALRLAGIVSVALLLCVSCRQLPREHSAPLAGELNEAIVPLARAALDAGQVETAKRLYGRLLEVDPGSAVARMGLGDTALREGASNRAIRWYREAIEYARAPSEARAATLAHARAALAAGDIETAGRSFGELAKDEDETVEAAWGFNGVGLTRLLQDDLRGAVTAMQEAVRRDPDEVRFRENLDRAMAMYRHAERDGLLPDLPGDPADGEASEPGDRTADPADLAAEQPYTDLDSAMTAVKDIDPEAVAQVAEDDAAPAVPEPSDVPTPTEGLDAVALDPPLTDASETTDGDTDSAADVPGAEEPAALADVPEPPEGEADEAGDDAPGVEPSYEDEAPALADAPAPADGEADEAGDDAPALEPASEDEGPALADAPVPLDGEADEPRDDAPPVEPATEDETPALADAPVPSEGEADDAGDDAPPVEPATEDETPALADAPAPADGEGDEPREDTPGVEPASEDDAPALADAPEPPDGESDEARDDAPSADPATEDDAPALADAPEPPDGESDEARDDAPSAEPASEDETPALADAPEPPDGESDDAGDDVPSVEPSSEDETPALADAPAPPDSESDEARDDAPLAEPASEDETPALADAPPLADGEADEAGNDVPSAEPSSEDETPALADAPSPADGEADEPREDAPSVEPPSEDDASALADAPVPPDGEGDEPREDVPVVEAPSETESSLAGMPELPDGDAVETDDVLAVDPLAEDVPSLTDASEPPMADDAPALEFPDVGSEDEEPDTADRALAGQDAESVRDADLGAEAVFDSPDSPDSRAPPPDASLSGRHQAAVEPSDASTDGADVALPDAPEADVGDLQLAAGLATPVPTGSDAARVGDHEADAEPAATVESADALPDAAPTDGDRTMRVWRGDSLFIEVGAHSGRAEADRSADELLDRVGLRPQIVAVSLVDGDTWFQVNVGPFETQADAAAVVGKVDSGGYDAWTYSVDPAPSRPEFYVAHDADIFWLQAGAYGSVERAMFIASVIGRIADMPVKVSETVVADGGVVYRVRLGPIGSRRELAILGEKFEEGGLAPIEIPTER